MLKKIFVLSWISVLVIGSILLVFKLQDDHSRKLNRDLGEACVHHVHNMSNPAKAELKGSRTVGITNPDQFEWNETLKCLQSYPLYGEQAGYSQFNTSLN